MTELPLITVVITVYNRAEFLAEAIDSVLAQSWPNLELVIVDDCSTDASAAIAGSYCSDPRVRFFRNGQNLGDYANRNYSASLARGEFMKFHDSDDIMYPHCIETMARFLIAEPRAAFALTSNRSWAGGPVPMLLKPEQSFEREFLGAGMFEIGPASALFRTDWFASCNGFDDVGPASDHLFWTRQCSRNSVLLVNADLFYYRIHSGQELISPAASRSAARVDGLIWKFLQSADVPLTGKKLSQARSNWLWIIAKLTIMDLKKGRIGDGLARLGQAKVGLRGWLTWFRRPVRTLTAGSPDQVQVY